MVKKVSNILKQGSLGSELHVMRVREAADALLAKATALETYEYQGDELTGQKINSPAQKALDAKQEFIRYKNLLTDVSEASKKIVDPQSAFLATKALLDAFKNVPDDQLPKAVKECKDMLNNPANQERIQRATAELKELNELNETQQTRALTDPELQRQEELINSVRTDLKQLDKLVGQAKGAHSAAYKYALGGMIVSGKDYVVNKMALGGKKVQAACMKLWAGIVSFAGMCLNFASKLSNAVEYLTSKSVSGVIKFNKAVFNGIKEFTGKTLESCRKGLLNILGKEEMAKLAAIEEREIAADQKALKEGLAASERRDLDYMRGMLEDSPSVKVRATKLDRNNQVSSEIAKAGVNVKERANSFNSGNPIKTKEASRGAGVATTKDLNRASSFEEKYKESVVKARQKGLSF